MNTYCDTELLLIDQHTEKSHNLTVLSYDPDTITSSLNCKQVTPSVCDFKVNSRSPVITLHTYKSHSHIMYTEKLGHHKTLQMCRQVSENFYF